MYFPSTTFRFFFFVETRVVIDTSRANSRIDFPADVDAPQKKKMKMIYHLAIQSVIQSWVMESWGIWTIDTLVFEFMDISNEYYILSSFY